MKKIIWILALTTAWAQNELDLLNISRYNVASDAKSLSMSNANVGIGADFGSMIYNPAALGFMNKFKVEGTLMFDSYSIDADYVGQNTSFGTPNFEFSNFGIAAGMDAEEGADFFRFNISYSNNVVNSYTRTYEINGTQTNHSQLDDFVGAANGTSRFEVNTFLPFDAGLAYEAYLINPLDTNANTYDNELFYFPEVSQYRRVKESGTLRHNSIAAAVNYNDKVYIGISLNIFNLDYKRKITHREEALDANVTWSQYDYTENLTQRGSGVNMNIGVIFRPVSPLKVGLWYNSPVSIKVDEVYETGVVSRFKDGSVYDVLSPIGENQYRMILPHRWGSSVAYQYEKRFSVSASYQMALYGSAFYREGFLREGNFSETNEVVAKVFRAGHDISLGTEFRVTPGFSLRAGASYATSPWKKEYTNVNNDVIGFSGGFGLRGKSAYLNFGLAYQQSKDEYYMYQSVGSDFTNLNIVQWTGLLTVGFRL